MAQAYWPLIVKSVCRLEPPLQWRGGMMCELHKGKPGDWTPAGFRDITLASVSAKKFGKHLRTHLMPMAYQMLADTQWGSGCFGGSTAVAHLYCRTMFH
eukprot:7655092-Karenia_brevis.AAC.1